MTEYYKVETGDGEYRVVSDDVTYAHSKSRIFLSRVADLLNAPAPLVGRRVTRLKKDGESGVVQHVGVVNCDDHFSLVVRRDDGQLASWSVVDCRVADEPRPAPDRDLSRLPLIGEFERAGMPPSDQNPDLGQLLALYREIRAQALEALADGSGADETPSDCLVMMRRAGIRLREDAGHEPTTSREELLRRRSAPAAAPDDGAGVASGWRCGDRLVRVGVKGRTFAFVSLNGRAVDADHGPRSTFAWRGPGSTFAWRANLSYVDEHGGHHMTPFNPSEWRLATKADLSGAVECLSLVEGERMSVSGPGHVVATYCSFVKQGHNGDVVVRDMLGKYINVPWDPGHVWRHVSRDEWGIASADLTELKLREAAPPGRSR